MKKILTSLTILFFLTQTLSANADSMVYSKQVRAKIMDQFKNDQYKNIYNNNNVFLAEENLNFFETDKNVQNEIFLNSQPIGVIPFDFRPIPKAPNEFHSCKLEIWHNIRSILLPVFPDCEFYQHTLGIFLVNQPRYLNLPMRR